MPIPFRNSKTQYGLGGRLLHWTSVALLVTLILTADEFESLDASPQKIELIKLHASWGLVFLLVMSLRVLWRWTNDNPVHSYSIHNWQKFAAKFLHRSIYVVVITQGLIGLVNLVSAGSGIPLFGLFETPAFMQKHELAYELSKAMHYSLSIVIYPLFAIHISAAIYHQLFGVLDD